MPDFRLIKGGANRMVKYLFARRFSATRTLPVRAFPYDLVHAYNPLARSEQHMALVLRVSTMNYATRDEREQDVIDANYQAFLNNLTHPIQWRFSVRRVDPSHLTRNLRQRQQQVDDEHVRCWLGDQEQHLANLVKEHDIPEAALHLVVPIAIPAGMAKQEYQEVCNWARKEAAGLETQLTTALARIGLGARRLGWWEILKLTWGDLNPDLVLTHKEPAYPGLLTMAAVPPDIKLAELGHHTAMKDPLTYGGADELDVICARYLNYHRHYLEINREHRCVLAVHGWPAYLQPNALRHLTNSNLNLDVALYIRPYDTDEALRFLDRRIGELTFATTKDAMKGYNQDHRVVKIVDQAKYCREMLEQGKARWFYTALYVAVTAPSRETLEQDVKTVEGLLNQVGLKASPAYMQQKEGLLTMLPWGLDLLQAQRNMLTDAVANLLPFDCQVYMQPGGFFAGINRLNSSVVGLNVWGLKNYNICLLGIPGSGKTVWERHKLTNHHCLTDDHQLIGDPEGEFDAMVDALGGEVIRLGAGSQHRINLMDLALDFDSNSQDHRKGRPLDKKIDLLAGWLEHYLGAAGADGERRFAPLQTARLKHAIVRTYGRYGITPENQGDILKADGRLALMPVLSDLQEELYTVDRDLAEAMDMFRFGTMAIFNARTNVNPDGRLVSLNLRDLDPATRDMAMPWLVGWMWNRVGINRSRKVYTHLYFEELLYFLAHPVAAEYLAMIWTRGRKWWCSPCGVSQLIGSLLQHPVGRTIVQSSDLKVLFDQGDAIDDVVAALKLSAQEAGFVRGSQPGEGLYVTGPWRVPFALPLSAYQYRYYTTRPGEMQE